MKMFKMGVTMLAALAISVGAYADGAQVLDHKVVDIDGKDS